MQVQKKSSKKPLFITILVVVLLLASIGVWYFVFTGGKDPKQEVPETTGKITSPNSKSDNGSSDKTPDNKDQPIIHEKEKDILPPYEGGDINNSDNLSGSINYKAVVDGKLVIRTTINQTLGSGSCQLTLRSDSKTVTRSADITPNPSSSSCQGFDIPVSELGSGNWAIEIKVSSGNRSTTLSERVAL